jgi:hypothetical protein
MIDEITLYNRSSGVNNRVDATRIGITEGAFAGLEIANNVYIDSSGLINYLPEKTLKVSGTYHSLYKTAFGFYVIADETSTSTLYYVSIDSNQFNFRTIKTSLTKGLKVTYTLLGDKLLYSNGTDYGYITSYVNYNWPIQINKRLSNLVAFTPGNHIDIFNGRVISLDDDEIIFSESFMPGLWDETKNRRRLSSDGTMLRSVGTGIFVSDSERVYFLRGDNPNEWKLDKVLDCPAIAYSSYPQLVKANLFGLQTDQLALLFNTTKGPCIGLSSGEVFNLIENKFIPDNDYNSLTVFEKTLLILSSDDGGITVQGAIGDIGEKAVTSFDDSFDSMIVTEDNELIGTNDSGLYLLFGALDSITSGLVMSDSLEMLDTLEMV